MEEMILQFLDKSALAAFAAFALWMLNNVWRLLVQHLKEDKVILIDALNANTEALLELKAVIIKHG